VEGTSTGTFSARFERIAESERFQNAIIAVILLNAVVLGIETFDGAMARHGDTLHAINYAFTAVFIVELAAGSSPAGRGRSASSGRAGTCSTS